MSKSKEFYIDFFTIRTRQDFIFDFPAFLDRIKSGDSLPWDDGHNQYKIKKISMNNGFYFAEFCKYRMDNLPHAGSTDTDDEVELELEDSWGLVEKNHFAYNIGDKVVIFQRNGNASRGQKIGKYLSEIMNENITFDQVVTGNSITKIMNDDVSPVMLEASIARPTNPALFPNDQFSKELFNWMSRAGGSRIKFTLTSDQRSTESGKQSLSGNIKSLLTSLLGREDVSVLKTEIKDSDGEIQPIDLIADRIYTVRKIIMNGRYPSVASAHHELKQAFAEKMEEIHEVIGNNPETRLV